MRTTVGMEIELNLITADGFIKNVADEILQDSRNEGFFVPEATHSQIELNSLPANTVEDLHQDIIQKLLLLEEICQDWGVFPVPVSEFGAGKSKSRTGKQRYDVYETILGHLNNEKLNTISGVHIHFSQVLHRNIDQYNVLQALDPLSFAVTTTSPIRYDGVNSLNCHRVNLVRNDVFQNYPLHAQLLPYPCTIEEIESLNLQRFEQWRTASGLSVTEFSKLFTPENTGYAPIRKRNSIGPTGTWEVRSLDSTTPSHALAVVALYKGCLDHMVEKDIPVAIASEDGIYKFSDENIILPSFSTLKHFEGIAIRYGLHSEEIASYLQKVSDFAREGLPVCDRKYLDILQGGKLDNPAHQIMKYLRSQGHNNNTFSPTETAQANLFMREQYRTSLTQ